MKIARYLRCVFAAFCVLASEQAFAAENTERSVVAARFLEYQKLVELNIKDKSGLWDFIDPSRAISKFGSLSKAKASLYFNGYSHDSYKIVKEEGNLVFAEIAKSTWDDKTPLLLVFLVKKKNNKFLIMPSKVDNRSIDPWALQGNGLTPDEWIETLRELGKDSCAK